MIQRYDMSYSFNYFNTLVTRLGRGIINILYRHEYYIVRNETLIR